MNASTKIDSRPTSPFHFDGSLHKPSHFPSSDNVWEEGNYWITMLWQGKKLGIHLINQGAIDKPKIEIGVYSDEKLSDKYLEQLESELEWRFNLKSDLSEFTKKFKDDKILVPILKKWALGGSFLAV